MLSFFSSDTNSANSVTHTRRQTELEPLAHYMRGSFFAMGSPCELLIECENSALNTLILDTIADEAWRIEDKFSRYLQGNIVAQINSSNGRPVSVDDETAGLLNFAATLTELSDGAFDITSGVLREAWQFDGSDNLPDAYVVSSILKCVGWNKVTWHAPRLTLRPGMQIDFGGIGKEYAVDRAAALVREHFTGAFLINFGGDVYATGRTTDAAGWQVGIESVDTEQRVAQTIVQLKNGGLATSGDARRYLLKDGIRYGHILDPATGWPIPDAPRSVSVTAETCTQAGMLATLAMLKGKHARSFLDAQNVQYWCYN